VTLYKALSSFIFCYYIFPNGIKKVKIKNHGKNIYNIKDNILNILKIQDNLFTSLYLMNCM
jgi:hypothetical protein